MKTLKYRQYWYGGNYNEEKLAVPENSVLIIIRDEVEYLVKDKEEYTKDYLLIYTGNESLENSIKIGKYFIMILNNIYIEKTDISLENELVIDDKCCAIIKRNGSICTCHILKKFSYSGIESVSVYNNNWYTGEEKCKIEKDHLSYNEVPIIHFYNDTAAYSICLNILREAINKLTNV